MDARRFYEEWKPRVDEKVAQVVRSDPVLYLLGVETPLGGKRLRGVLTVLVGKALGARNDSDLLDAAAAIELAHATSLDADDIIDGDTERRGRKAAWIVLGIRKAVLATHAMVASAFRLVSRFGPKLFTIISRTYWTMVRGELGDILGEPYTSVVTAKTASLWGAAAAAGAIVAGADDETVKKAVEYGTLTGVAFQIADDIVDTMEIVEKGNVAKLRSPSTVSFLAWMLGESAKELVARSERRALLETILAKLDDAMKSIDEIVAKAEKIAAEIAVVEEYREALVGYPKLAVEMKMREGGLARRTGRGGKGEKR